MLDEADHRHDEGEDAMACANCRLAALEQRMSGFECAVWNWYMENVTQLTMESGAAGLALYSATARLEGAVRSLFTRATTAIYKAFEQVAVERQKAEAKQEKN